jgi:hypothetical protein
MSSEVEMVSWALGLGGGDGGRRGLDLVEDLKAGDSRVTFHMLFYLEINICPLVLLE